MHTLLLRSKVEEIVKKKYLNIMLIEILLSHIIIVPYGIDCI